MLRRTELLDYDLLFHEVHFLVSPLAPGLSHYHMDWNKICISTKSLKKQQNARLIITWVNVVHTVSDSRLTKAVKVQGLLVVLFWFYGYRRSLSCTVLLSE